jgi:diketogulonate reductase-like aldo/keto reductase
MTEAVAVPASSLPGGVEMPMIGFGTWQLRGRAGRQAVLAALQAGYRHIDTATMYGNEAEVGRALRDSGLDRQDVFVTTKMQPSSAGRERAILAASLRELDTEYVDLWLVHWPPSARQLVPVWREFVALRDEGKALSVGVSNYSVAQIDVLIRATGQPPAVNQIPWGPALYDPGVLAASRDLGVVVEGYSPLKNTNLNDPVLAEIAARHGVTPAQVVLRWHIEHGVAVIPKSARPERIAANIDLFGFALTAGEIALIDGLSAR